MKHFSAEQLIDYARGLTPAAEAAAMAAHVTDCPNCRQTLTWLSRAWQAASSGEPEVPAVLVARAKALFQPQPAERGWLETLRELTAVLVSQSAPELLPEGVRGGGLAGQFRFQAGPYVVDLSMEQGPPPEIVGQLANQANPQEALGGALVEVRSGQRTLGATETNQFGEFIVDRPAARDLALAIALREAGARIVIPLKSPAKTKTRK